MKKVFAGAALAVLLAVFLFVAFLAVPVQRLYDRCHETELRYQVLLPATVPVFDAEQVDKIVVSQSSDPDFPAERIIEDPEEIAAICAIWARASAEDAFEVLGPGKEQVTVLSGCGGYHLLFYQDGAYAGDIYVDGVPAPLIDPHRTLYATMSVEDPWVEPDEYVIPERYRYSPTLSCGLNSGKAGVGCFFAITQEEKDLLDALCQAEEEP